VSRYPDHVLELMARVGLRTRAPSTPASTEPTLAPLPAPEAAPPAPDDEAPSPDRGARPDDATESHRDGRADPPRPTRSTDPKARLLIEGERHLDSRDWSAALDAFGRAAEIAPGDAQAHLGKARAYLGLGRPRLALTALDRAQTTRPDLADVAYQRGLAHAQLGDRSEAVAAFRAFLRRAAPSDARRAAAEHRIERLRDAPAAPPR